MDSSPVLRQRLLSILAADAAGYSRLMADDDRATVLLLDQARQVFRSVIETHDGRVIDMAGDSVLAVFETARGAVNAAIAVQAQLAEAALVLQEQRRMRFRIGIHLGDVIVKADGSVYGDGVNIAARLQALAQPGDVNVSAAVHCLVASRVAAGFDDLGEHRVKNIAQPVRAFRVRIEGSSAPAVAGSDRHSAPAADAGAATAIAGRARPVAPTNLTFEADTLIGRDAETQALCGLLAAHRLVSLIGSGGIGKTRLARAVARRSLDAFADGVWWIDLTVLSSGERIAQAVAQASGTPLGDGDDAALLARALAPQTLLLVLDNCEHLAAGVTAVLQALLAAAPGVRVLATSQVALHVPGEQVWRLDALALAPPGASLDEARGFGALALFEQRARAADQRFVLDADNVAHAVELCRRLDGNALAIEMAAARAPQIGLAALNERLGERLRMLRAGGTAASQRQQSLRTLLDWSCSLLDDAQRSVLRRLSVFAGSFRLDTAQQVVADAAQVDEWVALDALGALVDRSLLHVEGLDPPRYRLLETTRLYAAEQLAAAGEAESTQLNHGQAMALLAEQARDDLYSVWTSVFVARHADSYDDLEAAFQRACARRDVTVAAATADALSAIDTARGVNVARRQRMVAAHGLLPFADDAPDRARLWNQVAAYGSISIGTVPRLSVARERVDAWRDVGDRRELYLALAALAAESARASDFAAAHDATLAALGLEDPAWPPQLRMVGARIESNVATYSGDTQAALRGFRKVLALAEESGDAQKTLAARSLVADAATAAGDLDEAIALGRAVVDEESRALGPADTGHSLMNLCAAYLLAGANQHAHDAAARALPPLRRSLYAGVLFNHLALLAVRGGDAEAAARLLGHADQWYATNQSPHRQATEARVMEAAVSVIDTGIGAGECARLRSIGAAFTEAQADALAWRILHRSPPLGGSGDSHASP